jgi:hypothetical protein
LFLSLFGVLYGDQKKYCLRCKNIFGTEIGSKNKITQRDARGAFLKKKNIDKITNID